MDDPVSFLQGMTIQSLSQECSPCVCEEVIKEPAYLISEEFTAALFIIILAAIFAFIMQRLTKRRG